MRPATPKPNKIPPGRGLRVLRTRGPRQLAPRRGELTCRAVRPDRGPTRARTGHLRFARAALYQMSYRPMAGSEYRPRGGTPMVHPDSVRFLGAPVRRRSWQASSCQLGTRTRHICSRPGLPAGVFMPSTVEFSSGARVRPHPGEPFCCGRGDRCRTCYLRFWRPPLYQVELHPYTRNAARSLVRVGGVSAACCATFAGTPGWSCAHR